MVSEIKKSDNIMQTILGDSNAIPNFNSSRNVDISSKNNIQSSDLLTVKEEEQAHDNQEQNHEKEHRDNLIDLNSENCNSDGKNFYLSSSSVSSSSSSSLSPVPFLYLNNNQNNSEQIRNRNITKKILKCICHPNQKRFDCYECTQNYPVNVRRSKDGEEEKKQQEVFNKSDQILSIKTKTKKTDPDEQKPTSITLKPSPIPVSSSLLSLLALTKPSNTFIPPPNKCISSQSHSSTSKTSASSSSTIANFPANSK